MNTTYVKSPVEPMEPKEPTESIKLMEPIEPLEPIEPKGPMAPIEPLEPLEVPHLPSNNLYPQPPSKRMLRKGVQLHSFRFTSISTANGTATRRHCRN